jgi:vesicle coat complex subunit
MSVGKDVSELFLPVLKCVETDHLQLKKLVYLYIINYAKTQPDLALLAVNTFRKDAREKVNPLIRGLAVRTLGCIGIEAVLEFLIEPLKDTMKDEDPYVRKTSALCVAKINDISPETADGFIPKLLDMISDGNGMVVSNAIAAITDIQSSRGKILTMN